MFIFSAKVTRKKIIIASCGVLAILALVCFPRGEEENAYDVLTLQYEEALTAMKIKSETDVYTYLNDLGWETDETPFQVEDIIIPEEFNDVYEKYNQLQIDQDLDLEKYKGKKVTLYSFIVNNHPSGETGVIANVLVYDKKVIAGDVSSSDVSGFIQGLRLE